MGPLNYAFLFLVAAVVAVPIAKRLGLGSVLGYLIAGIVIGPAFELIGSEAKAIKHFAEFGVVMMLFLVGLELRPSVLWRMRRQLMGLGGLQVLVSTVLLFGGALAFGLEWRPALAVGMTLALSSTAIVLQTLGEKGWLKSPAGQSCFSVLLFQDIAVIPMLALLPLLATGGPEQAADTHHTGLLADLPGWLQALVILAAMGAIVLGGRFVMRPIFRFIAQARLREIFTAAALLLVIGVALLMTTIGLSPALGTFLAGVVLSGSEYRRELESDVEPFKGLLLGLFFISVGAGMNFDLLFGRPLLVIGLALGILAVKFLVLRGVAALFKRRGEAWLFSLSLAQAGEFAFVLFAFTVAAGVVAGAVAQILTLVVAVTMLLTPLMFVLYERVIAPRAGTRPEREADEIDERGTAIIAGVGRFGLVVNRMLATNGYSVVVLDHDAGLIELLRRIGIETYYGDATRPDLIHAAGIEEARLFVAALDDREKQTELVEHVAHNHPHCRIIARALDRHHIYELEKAGAHYVEREQFESALSAGRRALVELGEHPFRAERQARAFRHHERRTVETLRENWHDGGVDQRYLDEARAHVAELYDLMKEDRLVERHDSTARGWTPPPRGDAVA